MTRLHSHHRTLDAESRCARLERENGRLIDANELLEQQLTNAETQARINQFKKGEAMTWTDTKPITVGYYWWRVGRRDEPLLIRRVSKGIDGRLRASFGPENSIPLSEASGQWCGPIPEPTTEQPPTKEET